MRRDKAVAGRARHLSVVRWHGSPTGIAMSAGARVPGLDACLNMVRAGISRNCRPGVGRALLFPARLWR
eukprot:scaffold5891_cov121-Isochrysis_galbana.AAC.6